MYGSQPVSSSILHLLCRCPILVVPIALGLIFGIPNFSQVPEECLPSSMVTFTFDDGYFSTYDKAFPILEKYSYPATVFVITSAIGEPGYMTTEQILELADNGWEIGSHTVSHPDLTQLSDEQLKYELLVSQQYLENLGLTVRNFSSPHGRYDKRVVKTISQYYDSHRTSWPAELNNLPLNNPEDRYYLKSVSVEAKTTVEEVKQWIIKAKEEEKWLILLFHHIDERGDYNWSSEDFEEVVKFVYEQQFEGVSMNEIN
jgi:peptidoglycan/xylan/chitin deacetylase (PgdA/CDA1 family)